MDEAYARAKEPHGEEKDGGWLGGSMVFGWFFGGFLVVFGVFCRWFLVILGFLGFSKSFFFLRIALVLRHFWCFACAFFGIMCYFF